MKKKNKPFRNFIAAVAKIERRWLQFRSDPKNIEVVNLIERKTDIIL